MELCKGGDLFDRLVARGSLPEPTAARLLRNMAEAIAHCHRHNCIHRDIKPENVLMVSAASDTDVKLVDFGVATFFQPGKRLTEVMGTPEYMAPELIRGCYGPEVDVFSTGVLMYTAMCGVPPFWASSRDAVKEAILTREVRFRYPKWTTVSEDCKQLVAGMLEKDPAKRVTTAQILGKWGGRV